MYKNASFFHRVPSVVKHSIFAEQFSKEIMIVRISLMFFVSSLLFFSFHGCLSDAAVGGDQFVDDFSVVESPEVEMTLDQDDKSYESSIEPKSRRLKRSSWSLPPNTSARMILDWIIPIAPLNNTFSNLVIDLIYRFVLPTYTQLNNLYGTLGRLDENNAETNLIDYEFFEEQVANKERRSVYQHAEGVFEK